MASCVYGRTNSACGEPCDFHGSLEIGGVSGIKLPVLLIAKQEILPLPTGQVGIRTTRKPAPREPAFFLGFLDRMFGDKYRASENMGLERTILLLLTFGEEHRRRDNRPNDGPISERADWEEKVLGFGGGGRAVFLARAVRPCCPMSSPGAHKRYQLERECREREAFKQSEHRRVPSGLHANRRPLQPAVS